MRNLKRIIAKLLVGVLLITLSVPVTNVESAWGAVKPKLSSKSLSVKVNKVATISVINGKKGSVSWKVANSKIVAIKKIKTGKYQLTGKKVGSTNITCTVKITSKKYTLKCKVYVKAASVVPTKEPVKTAVPTVMPTSVPTVAPTATPVAIPTSLKQGYEPIVGKVGNCISLYQLQNAKTLAFFKSQYNSFTLENEMKPDSLLGWSATKLTVADAKAAGMTIPTGYSEEYVPQINFTTIDKVLKIAYDNGLKVRAHTLVWHSQTPSWFFKSDFASGTTVTPEIMDKRMEYYIVNVMKHVYDNAANRDVVYAWDVANEYLHNDANNNWSSVYGNREGNLETNPPYLKKAFTIAHNMLVSYSLQDKVSLFYNDYNEYEIPDQIVSLIQYINGDGKVCNGVGMQSHIDLTYPTVDLYGEAIDKFKAAGFEIQITELDVTINYKGSGKTLADQAVYYGDLMRLIKAKKAAGANITGMTIWGMYDNISWRSSFKPTLFGKSITDPKAAYTEVLKAAVE